MNEPSYYMADTARDRAALAVGRAMHDRRDVPLTLPMIERLVALAFVEGALWGIERTQRAVSITHARYKTEAERGL